MYSPIAIVGMGCRFPGRVNNPNDFWNLLIDEIDAIDDVPKDRWNHKEFHSKNRNVPGGIISQQGGFLKDIAGFDSKFFGIQANEAMHMDPQQRIALQVTWEAFEQGGLNPKDWSGKAMGVYMGCFTADYQNMQFLAPNDYSIYSSTGMMNTMLSNRISHCFDFCGPSMSIDTACSASMTAIHQACLSLQNKESDAAIAGGALLMLLPDLQIAESKTGFLSKDSRCKAFGAEANGYVRSEGAGVIILKRLDDAINNHDQIQGVIIGSAINQDGATNSITLPSKNAQIQVMQETCRRAGLKGEELSFIEAHGTGTSAGDSVEAQSIAYVYRNNKNNASPLFIGSCKSNIGHLEAASGIAGVIKTVLCLKHGIIPKTLHTEQLNPNIPFEQLGILPAQQTSPLPRSDQPLIAAVNSFGFGGSNAHIIIRQVVRTQTKDQVAKGQVSKKQKSNGLPKYMLPISAMCLGSLRELVALHHNGIQRLKESQLEDWCYSASKHRVHHAHRHLFWGDSKNELTQKMGHFLRQNEAVPPPSGPKADLVWVFAGMGHLTYGETRSLFKHNSIFRQKFLQCNASYKSISKISLIHEIKKLPENELVTNNDHSHALCFFNQLSIAAIWQANGIQPDCVLGHSGGEFAAFYFAKIYSLDECMQIIAHRAHSLKQVNTSGAMLSVKFDLKTAQSLLQKYKGAVSIAAHNSKKTLTLSGEPAAIIEIQKEFKEHSIPYLKLPEKIAFHNLQLLQEYKSNWDPFKIPMAKTPQVKIFSSLTGAQLEFEEISQNYFLDNLLQPVQFFQAVQKIIQSGNSHFLEISLNPKLIQHISSIGSNTKNIILNKISNNPFVKTLAHIYQKGFELNWDHIHSAGTFTSLPTYPWQNTYFWKESDFSKKRRLKPSEGVLLGHRENQHDKKWISQFSVEKFPWLQSHVILGEMIIPGACYIELALEALHATFPNCFFCLNQIQFHKVQRFEMDENFFIRTKLDHHNEQIYFSTRKNLQDSQYQNTASLCYRAIPIGGVLKTQCNPFKIENEKLIEGNHFYDFLKRSRFEYKNQFCGIQKIKQSDLKTHCEISIPMELLESSCHFHPIVMDENGKRILKAPLVY